VSILNFNKDLTEKCLSFLDLVPATKILECANQQDLFWNAHIKRLRYNAEIVIGIDEDCFIFDIEALRETVEFILLNKYAYAGCPEGVVACRKQHDKIYTNSFFCIFNMKVIRESEIDFPSVAPIQGETYWPIFQALDKAGKGRFPLYLKDWDDGVTTVISSPSGKEMALHTWYARDYGKPEHYQRINNAYNSAVGRKHVEGISNNANVPA